MDNSNNSELSSISKRPYSQHFDADVKMFGDKITLTQIVILLSYIRHFIETKTPGEIKITVGKNLDTEAFTFTVNDEEIQHITPGNKIDLEIN